MKTQAFETKTTATSQAIPTEEFLTTKELMKFLKIKHRLTIYNFIKQGMPAIKVGKDYRFIKSEVIGFFRNSTAKVEKELKPVRLCNEKNLSDR